MTEAGTVARAASAAVEALERRQMLTVTSAGVTGPSSVAEHTQAAFVLSATDTVGNGTTWYRRNSDGSYGPGYTFVPEGQSVNWYYNAGDEGSDELEFAVYDGGGSSGSGGSDSPYYTNPQDIDVTDAPVTFQPSQTPLTATEGQSAAVLLGVVLDGDPSPDGGDYNGSQVAWSDGGTSSLTFVGTSKDAYGNAPPPNTSAYQVFATRAFADEGTVTGNVTIADEGGSGDTGSAQVNVADARIGVAAQSPNAVVGHQFTSVVGVLTDQNPNGSASDFNTTIDWGDGSTSTGTLQPVSGQPGTFDVVGSHTYADFGTFNMTVTAVDDGGSTASGTYTNYLPAPTITVQSVTVGVDQTLDAQVTLSGQNVSGQSLTVVSYDSNVAQVGWDGGSTTDANGTAELAITGVAAGQTNVVVALANFANVQGQGQEQVKHDTLTLDTDAIQVCTKTGTAGYKTITATLTNPDGSPAKGVLVEWSDYATGGEGYYGVHPTTGHTDASGRVQFQVYAIESDGGEPNDLQIEQADDTAVFANAQVTVVVPQLTISPSPSAQLMFDANGNPVPLAITVTAIDPTTETPISGINLLATLTNNGPVEFAQITNDTLTTNQNGVETITVQAVSTRTDLSAVLTVSDDEANGEQVMCDLTPQQQA